ELEAVRAGHLDVEKDHVGTALFSGANRLIHIRRLADDLHIVMFAEQAAESAAREAFVVHNERLHSGITTSARTRPSSIAVRVSDARSPYMRRSRSRAFSSPIASESLLGENTPVLITSTRSISSEIRVATRSSPPAGN